MKLVSAIIKPFKLQEVRESLVAAGVDGKIFITNLEDVIRIRTGETGSDAV